MPARRKLNAVRLIALVVGSLLLAAGLFAAHRFQLKRQVGTWKDRAAAAADRGDWKDAAEFYQTYLNFQPDDADAVARYAEAVEKSTADQPGAEARLMRVYERLVRLDPTRTAPRRKLARWYLDQRQFPNTRDQLEHLLARPPADAKGPDPELLGMLAACDAGERKFDAARAALEKAVATGAATPDLHLALALLLRNEFKTGDAADEADKVMNALVAARPDDIASRLARARYRMATENPAAAGPDVDRALALPGGDKDPTALLAKADVEMARNDLPAARTALEKAAAAVPDNPAVRMALANVQARLNDPTGAAATLKGVADKAEKPTLPLLEAADKLIDLRDAPAALKYAEKFAAEPGLRGFADYLAGRAKLADGDWPAALPLLARAAAAAEVQRVPAVFLKAQLAVADCHARAGNPDQQLAVAAAALRGFPDSPAAKLAHADALARVGKTKEAADAYQGLAADSPAARAAYLRLRLPEVLAQPPAVRDWPAFEKAFGPKPYPADIELVRAAALLQQGKPKDAEAALTAAADRFPKDPRPRLALAGLKDPNDPAALALIEAAAKDAGESAEVRLARARLLAGRSAPDANAVRAVADGLEPLSPADRGEVRAGVAGLLAGLGDRAAATALYRQATADRPFDLAPRAALFDLALLADDPAARRKAREDIAALEGPDGPVGLAADIAEGLRAAKPGDAAAVAALRAKLKAATEKRESWGRLAALAGDVDQLDGQTDAAIDAYRKALDLGDRSELLVRKLVRLLIDRGAQAEALALLTRLERDGPLSPDLRNQRTLLGSLAGEDPKKGLEWATSAAARDSASHRDQLYRAAVFALADRRADAEAAVRKAVELSPGSPEVWVALVRFLASADRPEDAKTALADAAKRLPAAAPGDRVGVPVALGACLEMLGDLKGAEERYRQAVAAAPADPAAVAPLARVLQRTNRRPEAEALYRAAADAAASPAVRRWAKRALALAIADGPDGYARLAKAHELIDQNLKDGNHPDDQRARAVLTAADPFRRTEAVEQLTAAAARHPLTPDENVLLARLYLRGGRPDLAAEVLREATRTAGPANPEYLSLLARVELQRGNPAAAKEAADRLNAAAPKSWEAAATEARVLAQAGRKADAAKRVRAWAGAADPAAGVALVGPLFDELGLADDAEAVYRNYQKQAATPAAHAPLAGFYLKAGRAADALALARAHEPTAPVGLTARLMSGAVRVRPPALVPAADRPAWEKQAAAVAEWIDTKLKADPGNADLRFARAELFDAAGKLDEEIAEYETALKAAPDNELFLNNLAVLLALAGTGSPSRPLELIDRAIAKAGPRPPLLDSRATIHIAAGRAKEAGEDLDVALGMDPRAVYHFHRAQAWDKLGETTRRDDAVAEAVKKGLTKAMLNPAEWPAFDKLVGTR